MASVTFTYGATVKTFGGVVYPDVPGQTMPQAVGRTMGGGFRVTSLGSGDWENPELTIENQNNTDYEAMRDFIQDTVSWSALGFTFTDPYTGSHTNMHYVSGLPEMRRVKGRWFGKIILSKDMSA